MRRQPGCGEATPATSRRRKSCPSVQIRGSRGTGSDARRRLRGFGGTEVGPSQGIVVQIIISARQTVTDGEGGEQVVGRSERGDGLAAVVQAGLVSAVHRCARADGDNAAESDDRDEEYSEKPHVWWGPGPAELGWCCKSSDGVTPALAQEFPRTGHDLARAGGAMAARCAGAAPSAAPPRPPCGRERQGPAAPGPGVSRRGCRADRRPAA
jgi:hypothetical protein